MRRYTSTLLYCCLLGVGCITVETGGGDNSGDDGCSSHDTCEWDEFCYESSCEQVLDRQYDISIYDAQVDEEKPDGSDWDSFGGAPDLFVVFYMENGDSCTTDTKDDDFSPQWLEECDFVFDGSDTFWFELWDEDLSDDDWAYGWYSEGSDGMIALARGSGEKQTLSDSGRTLELTFRVDPAW